MPRRQIAVVVLVNSRSPAADPIGRLTFRPAETLAANIGYNLLPAYHRSSAEDVLLLS